MPAFSAVATCFGCSAYRFRRFGKDKAFGPVFGGRLVFGLCLRRSRFPWAGRRKFLFCRASAGEDRLKKAGRGPFFLRRTGRFRHRRGA